MTKFQCSSEREFNVDSNAHLTFDFFFPSSWGRDTPPRGRADPRCPAHYKYNQLAQLIFIFVVIFSMFCIPSSKSFFSEQGKAFKRHRDKVLNKSFLIYNKQCSVTKIFCIKKAEICTFYVDYFIVLRNLDSVPFWIYSTYIVYIYLKDRQIISSLWTAALKNKAKERVADSEELKYCHAVLQNL